MNQERFDIEYEGNRILENTRIDGNFSVSGKKGSTLVFSYIGMLTQEVVYKGTALRVVMKDDSKALEEVVVIGYQTVKKSDLTGAVAVVDTKEKIGRAHV